jgi:hypothetical protein
LYDEDNDVVVKTVRYNSRKTESKWARLGRGEGQASPSTITTDLGRTL